MLDSYKREVNYLRVSVTDRCNFRCAYCMPPEGVKQLNHDDILTFEEIVRVINIASRYCGINKVRLTGGEPLVRTEIVELVRAIKQLGTIADLAMTTNGSLLADLAESLKQAGLDRINISIDTLNEDRYRGITRGGNLQNTMQGLQKALQTGLEPLKVNVVLTAALTKQDLQQFYELACQYPLSIRFIEFMPVGYHGIADGLSVNQVKTYLSAIAGSKLQAVKDVKGAGPARNYELKGVPGTFGFITPISDRFCQFCNRMRLTADGRLKPCLLSDAEFDIKQALRSEASDERIAELMMEAIMQKPVGHNLTSSCQDSFHRRMCQIGG